MRTSPDLVRGVLLQNYDGKSDLRPFISMAVITVAQMVACAAKKNITHTSDELEMVERLMSAHFYTQADPLYKSKSTDGSSGSFADTDYSKTASQLDSSGCLQQITTGTRKKARMKWAGTRRI